MTEAEQEKLKNQLETAVWALEKIAEAPFDSLWNDDRDDAAWAMVDEAKAALKRIKAQK